MNDDNESTYDKDVFVMHEVSLLFDRQINEYH